MRHDSERNFFTPLSKDGPYRYNPHRAKPPRVYAAPRFFAMLSDKTGTPCEGIQECLDKLRACYPVVTSGFMEGGQGIRGGFFIHTIWANQPCTADVIFVKGPGDSGYLGLPLLYEQARDESLLEDLISLDFLFV